MNSVPLFFCGRASITWIDPYTAMFEDLFDHISLAFFDETDNFHLTTAFWTFQRVNLVNALDERSPAHSALFSVGCIFVVNDNLHCLWGSGSGFISQSSWFIRVPAIATNEMLSFFRDMLCDFSQKIQGIENLKVSGNTVFQIAAWISRKILNSIKSCP